MLLKRILLSFLILCGTQIVHADGFFHSLGNFVKHHKVASGIIGVGVASQVGLFSMFHWSMDQKKFIDFFTTKDKKVLFKKKDLLTEMGGVGVIDIAILLEWKFSIPTSLLLFGILNKAEKDSMLTPFWKS